MDNRIDIKRDLLIFFVLELFFGILAGASFHYIPVRFEAAMVAGTGFLILGVWLVLKTLRWPGKFNTLTYYLARVHLYIFSLPMLLVRIFYARIPFDHLHFVGIPGPVYHRAAEVAYMLLMIATVIDWLRLKIAAK